jgi:hypothetical protein
MALRNQPYIPLYAQDFSTDEKLMECSASATGIFIRIMCVMHKSETYGTILIKQKDKQSTDQILNFAHKIARFLPYNLQEIISGLKELLNENVLSIEGDLLIQKRMMNDGILSDKRSLAGSKGGKKTGNKLKNFAKAKTQANTEYEYEYENEVEIKNKNEVEIKKSSEIDFEKILEIFSSVCVDLPQPKKITPARKTAIKNRVRENSIEDLGRVFTLVHESDFLSGRKTDFKASLDWILNPTNFLKILEGNYKNLEKNGTEKSNIQIFTEAVQSDAAKFNYFDPIPGKGNY